MSSNPYAAPLPAEDAPSTETAIDWRTGQSIDPEQLYVDWLLRRGVLFSIVWLFGFGSMYSVYLAFKAHRTILESDGKLRGAKRIVWCYVFGGFGCFLFGTVVLSMIVNR